MPTVSSRNFLTGILAGEIMRRQIFRLKPEKRTAEAMRQMIKYRRNAVLVDSGNGMPEGVVSKTDIMMAYYGGLPVETPIGDIMMGPVQTCFLDDTLESALATMQTAGVHQLFVRGAAGVIDGVLSYGDIVGLVYRYCSACERSRRKAADERDALPTRRVRDVMSTPVAAVSDTDGLAAAMDVLAAHRLGAVLVTDADGSPAGVISKSDLAIAYLHGTPIEESAAAVMTTPVTTCTGDSLLSEAIQTMLLHDIQRIFVCDGDSRVPAGVLSLSDAARFRSGTCRACTTSRLVDVP